MNSADTNLLIRVIVKDDTMQTALAAAAFEEPIFVSHGVIMETEWVLRSSYRLSRDRIVTLLRRLLLHTQTLRMVEPNMIAWCLDRYAAGADLADMLHIVASYGRESFLTFDAKLAASAGSEAPTPVKLLA